jgi:hypothetical protein
MKIRGGFACIVGLMALMVLVLVVGRATPDPSTELASSENVTVAAAADTHDTHTHDDPTVAHDHADGAAAHDHTDPAAAHDHGDGGGVEHDHGDGSGVEHDHGDGASVDDPTHCHVDCPPGTPEDPNHEHPAPTYTQTQLDLLAATQAWISPRFDDVNDAIAAGYLSIGDAGTGYEHYVNNAYLNSPQVLTPQTIESLVYKVSGNARTLVSGMYILPIGQTFDDVPVAFNTPQTPWHVHSNLCWKLDPIRVVGTTSAGQAGCPPDSIYFVTPPMLHTWLQEQPCGWFADLEQANGDCSAHPH